MRSNKIIFGIVILLFNFFIYKAAFAAVNDPVSMLQSVANRMISALKANKATLKTNRQLVYSLANRIVIPSADLDEASKRVLPPRVWQGATTEQRIRFKREFTTLLIRTYASALAQYTDQVVQFYPIRGGFAGKSTIEVSSDIVDSGPPIHVVYRLIRVGSQWKLYDMSVEGVSLIESFRSQFADILSQGDINTLLQRMSQHNTRS